VPLALLVDLTECSFIDSTIIEVLIGNAKDLEREGHFLEIVAPPEKGVIARTLEQGLRETGAGGALPPACHRRPGAPGCR